MFSSCIIENKERAYSPCARADGPAALKGLVFTEFSLPERRKHAGLSRRLSFYVNEAFRPVGQEKCSPPRPSLCTFRTISRAPGRERAARDAPTAKSRSDLPKRSSAAPHHFLHNTLAPFKRRLIVSRHEIRPDAVATGPFSGNDHVAIHRDAVNSSPG